VTSRTSLYFGHIKETKLNEKDSGTFIGAGTAGAGGVVAPPKNYWGNN